MGQKFVKMEIHLLYTIHSIAFYVNYLAYSVVMISPWNFNYNSSNCNKNCNLNILIYDLNWNTSYNLITL